MLEKVLYIFKEEFFALFYLIIALLHKSFR